MCGGNRAWGRKIGKERVSAMESSLTFGNVFLPVGIESATLRQQASVHPTELPRLLVGCLGTENE